MIAYYLPFAIVGLVGGMLGYNLAPADGPIGPIPVGVSFFLIAFFLPPFIMDKFYENKETEEGTGSTMFGYLLGLIITTLLCGLIIFLLGLFS